MNLDRFEPVKGKLKIAKTAAGRMKNILTRVHRALMATNYEYRRRHFNALRVQRHPATMRPARRAKLRRT